MAYYGMGQASPAAGSVGAGSYALSSLPSRETNLRRTIYRQFWNEQTIAAGTSLTTTFFNTSGGTERANSGDINNSMLNIRKAALLKKCLIVPAFGTSGPDQAALFERAVVHIEIGGDIAYKLLAKTLNTGIGFTGGTPLVSLGEQAPAKAFDLGMVPLGAGQSFAVKLVYPEALATANAIQATALLHVLSDEPIS